MMQACSRPGQEAGRCGGHRGVGWEAETSKGAPRFGKPQGLDPELKTVEILLHA